MTAADALLIARLQAGDDDALAEAYDRFATTVFGVARSVLGAGVVAQDVVQDTFVALWTNPGGYDPAGGSLRGYLVVIARHRALDFVRSELRRLAREIRRHRLTPEPDQPSPFELVASTMTAAAVRAAVTRLPDTQRQVVELAYFEGLSYREVAAAVGIPEGTAKSRLRLALARLEGALDRQLLESS